MDLPRPRAVSLGPAEAVQKSRPEPCLASESSVPQQLPYQEEAVPRPPQRPETTRQQPSAAAPVESTGASLPTTREQRVAALEAACRDVAACQRCQELATTRTQTVFGVGNPQARLAVLGEAPGADEDRQGEPFVGRAGQLLTKILEACSLRREDVYILNILKCRPPGNRNPLPQEAANCREHLLHQLRIIRPEFICCLGAVAAQNLLETTTPIGQLRGKIHLFGSIKVVATYHPAYLLRNPAAKRATWDDMKMLMNEMGIEIPEGTREK